MIRIGHGFDVHAFGEDRPLIIGGRLKCLTTLGLLPILMAMSPYMP